MGTRAINPSCVMTRRLHAHTQVLVLGFDVWNKRLWHPKVVRYGCRL